MPRASASPSPTLPPQPQDQPPTTSPFFLSPPPQDLPSTTSPFSPSLPDPEPAPGLSSNPERSPDARGSASPSDTPSTGSKPLGRAQLRKVAGTAVTALGGALSALLTQPGSPERDLKLWELDDQDATAIGEPLAGIAARRVPSGVAGPDTPDVVALVVGLVGYIGKQFAKRQEARSIRAEMSAAYPIEEEAGTAA